MSEGNVERHRRFYAALNARDIDAMLALVDPSCEWRSAFSVLGGVLHGHEGVREWHRDLEDAWGEVHVQTEAYFDLGEHTLAFNLARGRGRHSGALTAMPHAAVARWRAGLTIYMNGYAHSGDALRDLGVSDDELEPVES